MKETGPIAAFPMYDWPELRTAHEAFWKELREQLCSRDIDAPHTLSAYSDVENVWLDPDLLISQTCGYPYATRLCDKVQLVATPTYRAEGCGEGTYKSAIVVSADNRCKSFKDTKGAVFAFNGRGSLSGYRCLTPMLAGEGGVEKWFNELRETGAHRASALMVANGEADIGVIDAVCWALFQRHEDSAAEKLRVLAWTPSFPALPFITSATASSGRISALRDALSGAIAADREGKRFSRDLLLDGVCMSNGDAYAVLSDL